MEGVDIDAAHDYHCTDTDDYVDKAKEEEWGHYKLENKEKWSNEQTTWYKWLKVDSAALAH